MQCSLLEHNIHKFYKHAENEYKMKIKVGQNLKYDLIIFFQNEGEDHLVQLLCSKQGQLEQVDQDNVQSDFQLSSQRLYNPSG